MTTAICLADEGDAAAIADAYRTVVESTPISFETEPPDEHEMRRRIADTLSSFPWLVCEAGGVAVGFAYASRHRVRAAYLWSVDVSVYIAASHRGRGTGRGLYTSLFAILAAQGFFNAYAGITLPNAASVGLHEAMGFQPIGVYRNVGYKLGAWHDVGWWQRPLQPPRDAPEPPLDLATVQRRPDWNELLASGVAMIRRDAGRRA
jgi:phosphinothricin acetyltransferase